MADYLLLALGGQQRSQRFPEPERDDGFQGMGQAGSFFYPGAIGLPPEVFKVLDAAFHGL